MGRRESSTPAATPTAAGSGKFTNATLVPSKAEAPGGKSPTIVRQPMLADKAKGRVRLNSTTWQSTGVINDIPSIQQNVTSPNPQNSANGEPSRPEGRRMVSRQLLAKSTFDQKQKMVEALDNARAAELALREILGSIKAAVYVITPVGGTHASNANSPQLNRATSSVTSTIRPLIARLSHTLSYCSSSAPYN
jgi:hypothetical protein